MPDEEIECPECGHVFYPDCDTAPLDAEDAAERLLENYTGHKPSAGEVDRLKERISEILVSEFGISAGEVDRLKERISEILVSEFGISAGVLP